MEKNLNEGKPIYNKRSMKPWMQAKGGIKLGVVS